MERFKLIKHDGLTSVTGETADFFMPVQKDRQLTQKDYGYFITSLLYVESGGDAEAFHEAVKFYFRLRHPAGYYLERIPCLSVSFEDIVDDLLAEDDNLVSVPACDFPRIKSLRYE